MKNFSNKKNILWDFDGVILDSMPIRNKGFKLVLQEFPNEQVELLVDYHLNNGGLSRYVKFRYFFEQIRGEKIDKEEINDWAEKFSRIMRDELVQPTLLIQDSLQFIRQNFKKYNMHIVSGSDGEELKYLCDELQISPYFISIEGSPTSKNKLVHNLLLKYKYKIDETILIGDSINDFQAAQENNIAFCGYNNRALKKLNTHYLEYLSKK